MQFLFKNRRYDKKMEYENIEIIKGSKKLILSAPHCVSHTRENKIRPPENRTKTIVKDLAKECDTYAIYKMKDEHNDANWDEICNYKENLKKAVNKEKIKALIDIHGMGAEREQDICIGTNEGKNIQGKKEIIDKMIQTFSKYGFKNITIDEPFAAKNKNCVSTYIARECGIPALQIEINLKYRSDRYKEYKYYKKLIDALKEIIELIL